MMMCANGKNDNEEGCVKSWENNQSIEGSKKSHSVLTSKWSDERLV